MSLHSLYAGRDIPRSASGAPRDVALVTGTAPASALKALSESPQADGGADADPLVIHQCSECWYLGPKWIPRCPSCAQINTLKPAEPEMCGHYFKTVRHQPPLTAKGLGRPSRDFDDPADEDGAYGGGAGGFGGLDRDRLDENGAPSSADSEEEDEGGEEEDEEEEDEDEFEPVEPATVARVASFKSAGIVRLPSSDAGVDHVFSGGIPRHHAFMLAASPGGGKSTLCRQIAAGMAQPVGKRAGLRVMIAAGEEVGDIANTEFKRLKLYKRFPIGARAVLYTGSDDTDAVIAAAKKEEVDVLIVDSLSILTSTRVSGAAGEKTQVNYAAYHLMQAAHASNEYEDTHPFTVVMISHVTKDGSMAGPNKAKHWTDGAFGIEHINPNTLEASEDQEKGVTGYVRLRVLGKYRRGSTLNHCYYQMTAHGLVPWKPKTAPGDVAPGAAPLVDAKAEAKAGSKKAAAKPAAKTTKKPATNKKKPPAPEKPAKNPAAKKRRRR